MEWMIILAFICGAASSTVAYRFGISDKQKQERGQEIKPSIVPFKPKPEKQPADILTEGFNNIMGYTGEPQKEEVNG